MYKFLKYSLFFCLCCALGCSSKPALPDLKESYSYTDPRPFGTSVAYNMLKNAYPNKSVTHTKNELKENYDFSYSTGSLYVNISRNYLVDESSVDMIMSFVKKGNTAFISSAYFDSAFFGRLFCTQNSIGYGQDFFSYLENTSTGLAKGLVLEKDTFTYFYKGFNSSFPELNGDYARYVGENENGKVNMFTFFYGKGKFIFHTEPRALSNYFLLTKNNYRYMQSILKMMPIAPNNIYWDNFYPRKNYARKGTGEEGSLLDAIKKSSALVFAFLAILGLFICYLLFSSKRKQRIVPVKKQTENSSIAFAEAIAGLYLNKKDNKVITEKMITYFNEHIRTKYYFTTNINDNEYAENLSRKSGVSYELTSELANTIRQSNARLKIKDEELLQLNSLIEKFLKHKK